MRWTIPLLAGALQVKTDVLWYASCELARTFVPFTFGGNADNTLYYCNEEQKQRYLLPTINGERRSCFALTEPGVGSDAVNIQMRTVKELPIERWYSEIPPMAHLRGQR